MHARKPRGYYLSRAIEVAIKCMKNHFDSIDQVNNLHETQGVTCVYVCMYMCVYIYIYIHDTHTYT